MRFCVVALVFAASVSSAWVLPPAGFLSDFVLFHDRVSIMIYLPESAQDKWIKWHHKELAKYDSIS